MERFILLIDGHLLEYLKRGGEMNRGKTANIVNEDIYEEVEEYMFEREKEKKDNIILEKFVMGDKSD